MRAMENAAFERAALQHRDRIHSYAVLMLRDVEEARDVSQEALVKLWQHHKKVDDQGAGMWLTRTTHNLCIDRIRKRKVRAEVDNEKTLPVQPDTAPGPGTLAESSELGRIISTALHELAPTDRAVVVMREVQGLAYDEIAHALNVPLGTLKARLYRARERLRARLVRSGVAP